MEFAVNRASQEKDWEPCNNAYPIVYVKRARWAIKIENLEDLMDYIKELEYPIIVSYDKDYDKYQIEIYDSKRE